MFFTPAYAQASGSGGFGSTFGSLIPLLLIFAIMYFIIIRPQQKKAKEHKQMVIALKRGDQILTQGGIIGKVTKVKDESEIEVEIASNTKVRVMKSTIVNVLNKT
ncbi:MAG: preprotein translocase subunit YajC [Paracoccaceae bacterium]|mgnify:FL=1|jgi:preprotein translocase subunit YajC|nr:preprotein translocase subunit YajC [Paracoccaceae bacterium]PQM57253.1 MAG: preprotein translocase subunit YajC [Paracoccaceae bacterium]|tara:strand:- start:1150 stop:1464 length:315 start_codon:yes stop_codon:yes gene_type:complete